MTSCKTAKPTVITNTYKETIKETVHDTVFEIAADSSAYQALLDCQNGKAVLKQITKATPGKNLAIPKVTIKDNQLIVDCLAEAQRLFAQWKSLEVYKTLTKQQPVYIEHELTFWERFFIGLGKIALTLGVITATIWIIKKQITAYGLKN
ncbi:hypothetical protein FUMI01_27130 [Flavobacterium sp. UMI-01]|nr:hypothetical protein FUMI01_27130 [Flavobacterium sp. UMI-01]